MRGQRIALDPVGKKLQGVLPLLARFHAQTHGCQAHGQPLRQRAALHGLHGNRHTVALQRHEPGAGLGRFVQVRQQHDGQIALVPHRRLGQLLQRGAAFFAGFAAGDTDFGDVFVRKQTHGLAGREHGAPVEVRAHYGVRCALAEALGAGGGPNLVQALELQERVVAVQHIQAFETALQMACELLGAELHGG